VHLSGAAIIQPGFAKLCAFWQPRRHVVFNPKFLDDISAKLSEVAANSPAKDVEKNVRALLAQGFAKLDLVTREEFDVQAEVLSRTRQKVEQLQARVAALEAQRSKP
jgi:BMFP domain-containing protein YqiC